MSNVLQDTGGNTLKVHGGGVFGSAAATSDVVMGLRNFYVSKTGSDANDGSFGSPVLTLLKATQLATTAGDAVHIGAGTYSENSGVSWFSAPATMAALYSGTLANPITFQAASGAAGSVIIDCLTTNVGIFMQHHDYIHIRNLEIKNCEVVGIVNDNYESASSPYFSSVTSANYSQGCIIEGCHIHNIDGATGTNIAAIRGDNSVGWIVRNNHLDYLGEDGAVPTAGDHTSGFQAYHTRDLLFENNLCENVASGILLKDHWLEDNGSAIFGAEIRYNDFNVLSNGVNLITGNTEPAGDHYVHHNIIESEGYGVTINSVGATNTFTGGYLDFSHNIVIAGSTGNTRCVSVDTGTVLTMSGNILMQATNAGIVIARNRVEDANSMTFSSSDYNIFDDGFFKVVVGLNGASEIGVNWTSLAAWQAAIASDHTSLLFSSPDANSNDSTQTALFTNTSIRDYSHKAGAMSLAFMSDNSSAGPYQSGTETIGLTGGGAY